MQRLGFSRGSEVRLAIDALVFIKLARSEEDTSQSSPSFTFAHRRFQEYFATCLVLRESARVAPSALLQDGRWRETAVTICQTQNHQSILPLIQEADEFLDTVLATTNSPLPTEDVLATPKVHLGVPAADGSVFSWPPRVLHVLGVLDTGFGGSASRLPDSLRLKAGKLLADAAIRGRRYDCKWAIEVLGAAPHAVFLWLMRSAFRSESSLLREAAYRQIGRLADVPSDLAADIRRMLLTLSVGGQLRAESLSVSAQLKRIEKSKKFLAIKRLLLAVPWIDFTLHAAFIGYLLIFGRFNRIQSMSKGVRGALVMRGPGAASGRGRPARRRPGRRHGPGTAARASGAAPRRWLDGRSPAPPVRAAQPAGGCRPAGRR
jgi:hypothetical protein